MAMACSSSGDGDGRRTFTNRSSVATPETFTCDLCNSFSAKSIAGVLRHIGSCHSHDPNFFVKCGINNCTCSYVNYDSFRRHLKRKHPEVVKSGRDESIDHYADDDGSGGGTSSVDTQWPDVNSVDGKESACRNIHQRALFLLKAREVHKMSEQALTDVMSDFSVMINGILDDVYVEVAKKLTASDISTSDIGLNEVFNNNKFKDPFVGLHSEHFRSKYYIEHMHLVQPVSHVFAADHLTRSLQGIAIKKDEMYYIPLLQSLQQLLSNNAILKEVENCHQQDGNIMKDFCDGKMYRNHELFSKDPNALQIILNYDDVEICNPLGSKAKVHKLGIFYYTLGNIRPLLRSSLKSIHLVSIVKTKLIQKYGINDVLEPFMNDIKLLEKDEGVKFMIEGKEKTFRGTLVIVSADNLASQLLGGYKCLASALRKCRFCMAISEDMKSKFRDDEFEPRTRETHASHIQNLNGALHKHISTTYGIAFESVLNSSRYFHVTECLVMDIMHDILEGILQYEVKELLKYLIADKICSLEYINRRISLFPYGYSDVANKPSVISLDNLKSSDHKLRQNAAQMWCLGRLLPLMIGADVPSNNEHWECFLLLMTIVDYVFAPVVSNDILDYLKECIEIHHQLFTEVYPASPIIPKLHYVIHIPEWIERCGPVSQLWCMRFEAKHSYLKSLANRVKNFKNIPKTLASRHQRLMCYYLQHPNGCLLSKVTKTGKGTLFTADEYLYEQNLKHFSTNITASTEIESVKWAQVNGTMYKSGAIIVTESELMPSFSKIVDILFINSDYTCLFVCKIYLTDCFNYHYHSYEVLPTEEILIIKQSDLIDYHILHQYEINFHSTFIPLKYHILEFLST